MLLERKMRVVADETLFAFVHWFDAEKESRVSKSIWASYNFARRTPRADNQDARRVRNHPGCIGVKLEVFRDHTIKRPSLLRTTDKRRFRKEPHNSHSIFGACGGRKGFKPANRQCLQDLERNKRWRCRGAWLFAHGRKVERLVLLVKHKNCANIGL